MHLAVVEQHVDLAVEHDGVVDRAGAVGEEVAVIALRLGIDAHLLEQRMMIDALRHRAVVRRKIHHAQDRAVRGRRHAGLLRGLIAGVRQIGRRLVGHPEQLHDVAFAALVHVRRRPVDQDDRLAAVVVAGDHAPDWSFFHFTPHGLEIRAASFGGAGPKSMLEAMQVDLAQPAVLQCGYISLMSDTPSGALRRRLNLPLLVLYGTGVTIGAGIYVLIGAVSSHAGMYAPLAFALAAVVMALTVASYAE